MGLKLGNISEKSVEDYKKTFRDMPNSRNFQQYSNAIYNSFKCPLNGMFDRAAEIAYPGIPVWIDIGCGKGVALSEVAKGTVKPAGSTPFRCVGIDFRSQEIELPVEFVNADMDLITEHEIALLPRAHIITSFWGMDYSANAIETFVKFYNHLEPGGVFVFTMEKFTRHEIAEKLKAIGDANVFHTHRMPETFEPFPYIFLVFKKRGENNVI
ncbi:class I SAM-dependent methyltransferase [Candidatus Micrarchaeota archaeon]|nr:class I SAM-dependent methyltransferase [Candidatus Micrarchaeota archaeon]